MPFASPELVPRSWTLRTAIALLGLAGVQFALIRWLGLLLGLTLPIVVYALVLTAVVLTAISKALNRREKMDLAKWEAWLQRLSLLIAVSIAALLMAGAGDVLWQQGLLLYQKHQVQQQLGFRYRSESHIWGSNVRSFPVVTHVEAGGCFDEAGISPDDVILFDESSGRFVEWLQKRQGNDFDLEIIPAGRRKDLTARTPRITTVHTQSL